MERIVKIDEIGRIEIPTVLLDELELEKKDELSIETINGSVFLRKKD